MVILMKRTFHFKDSQKFLKYRQDLVRKRRSTNWDDGWASDPNWLKKMDGFFSCKFCAGKMYAAQYSRGEITLSCRTTLCPGNIDERGRHNINYKMLDIKKMTNQYLFDSMMRF